MRAGSVEGGGARAREAAWALVVGASLVCGCMETRRAIGEDCLKNGDCLSGVCSQLVCAARPPTTDMQPAAEAGASDDGAIGATSDAQGGNDGSTADNDASGE